MVTPRLIGIGGPSGSGKSTLAARLASTLPGGGETVSLDSYYFPLDHLSADERVLVNFDHPDALDWVLLAGHLAALRAGQAFDEPIYRFDLHTRDLNTRRVEPVAFIVVEGILALHHAEIRSLFDVAVYIETAKPECYRRRLHRDTIERGRTSESVQRQYAATVQPMAELFVWPTRQHAHVVVSGEGGYEEPVEAVHRRLGLA